MSNNIYDILKKMQNLEAPKQALTESKTMSTVKELHNESKKEKLTVKGSIAEAVRSVESQLNEKYMGFKKTVAAIKKGGSAENPEAVAAAIGRKKYGKEKFQKAAAAGKKLGEGIFDLGTSAQQMRRGGKEPIYPEIKPRPNYNPHYNVGTADDPRNIPDPRKLPTDTPINKMRQGEKIPTNKEKPVDESGLQAYLGKKKYGEQGMQALQKAGRDGASKEKMAQIRARHDKMDEGEYNEDMLSPGQKKIASMAGDPDKIDAKDFAALRGQKKGVKKEGNKFTAGLANDDVKVGEKIPGTNAVKTKDIDEGQPDGPEYQSAWKRTQDERKAWEKSNPDKKYYDQGPADRHSMELSKARDADRAAKDAGRSPLGRVANTLSRGLFGQELPEGRTSMREGWEEMQKYLEKKRGPESKGGEGKKAGTRYGGSAQKDDDEETDGEGQAVVKKKGRPKGTGGGAKFSFKKPKD